MLEFRGKWEDDLPLVESSYNNSYQSTIKMPSFEALCGRKCRTPFALERLRLGIDLGSKTNPGDYKDNKEDLQAHSNCLEPTKELC